MSKKVVLWSLVGDLVWIGLLLLSAYLNIFSWTVSIIIISISVLIPLIILTIWLWRRRKPAEEPKQKEEPITEIKNEIIDYLKKNYYINVFKDFNLTPRNIGELTEQKELTPIYDAEPKDKLTKNDLYIIINRRNKNLIGVLIRKEDEENIDWEKRKEILKREFAEKPVRIKTRKKKRTDPTTGIETEEEETEELAEEKEKKKEEEARQVVS